MIKKEHTQCPYIALGDLEVVSTPPPHTLPAKCFSISSGVLQNIGSPPWQQILDTLSPQIRKLIHVFSLGRKENWKGLGVLMNYHFLRDKRTFCKSSHSNLKVRYNLLHVLTL